MDKREFSERSMRCANRLYRIAYLMLRNEADCEDATQEALLRAWAKRDTLREKQYFETWLVRILINESKRILRHRGKVPELLDEDLCAPEPADPALREAVRALQIKYRAPLILHHLEGYSVREVGEILTLPETAVKWRLRQARKLLKGQLIEEGVRI